MFIIHVDTVDDLRNALLPLATICPKVDIKCTIERLSIIGVPSAYPFIASLRMLPAFFTSFLAQSDGDVYMEYRSRFILTVFATNICNLYTDNLSMTMYLGENPTLAPLKFEDPSIGYLQYSALVLSQPLNIDISPVDYGVFVAIRSPEFINLICGLGVHPNELVSVSVTATEAKFSGVTREVIFKTENNDCVIGGIQRGSYYFMVTFYPVFFFYHIACASKFVWLSKTISSRNVLSCCVGLHASYLVCF